MTVLATYPGIAQEGPEAKVLTRLIELGAQFAGVHEGALLVVDEASNEPAFAMTWGRRAWEKPWWVKECPGGKDWWVWRPRLTRFRSARPPIR
jgi:hypothetical protein